MKATVVEIQSQHYFEQGYRTVALKFEFGPKRSEILRLPESSLGIIGIALDDEIDVSFSIHRERWTSKGEQQAKV